jgi:recombinational DNA repair protein (RecF pathway)
MINKDILDSAIEIILSHTNNVEDLFNETYLSKLLLTTELVKGKRNVRHFLECLIDDFMVTAIKEPNIKQALLDLLTSRGFAFDTRICRLYDTTNGIRTVRRTQEVYIHNGHNSFSRHPQYGCGDIYRATGLGPDVLKILCPETELFQDTEDTEQSMIDKIMGI